MPDFRPSPDKAHPIGSAPHRGHRRPALNRHHEQRLWGAPMPRIRRHLPRPMVHTVLGHVVSSITRTLIEWLLQHLTH